MANSSSSDSDSSKSSKGSRNSYKKNKKEKESKEPRSSKRDRHSDSEESPSKKRRSEEGSRYHKNRTAHEDRSSHRDKDNQESDKANRYRGKDGNYESDKYDNRSDKRRYRNDDNERYRRYNDRDNNRFDRSRNYQNFNNSRDNRDNYSNNSGRYRNNSGGNNRYNRNKRNRSRSNSVDHANAKWGKQDSNNQHNEKKKPVEKEKANFGTSGKLTEETNTYRGVVIKYSEPPEARKPKRRWRLYPFKGEKALQTLYIHRESAYLVGRDRKVVDLPVDHPSCSKQHAVLQYRLVSFIRDDFSTGKRVRPYLIDLDSANGTYINNKKVEPKKYIELLERDVIKFGFSSREYVLLHENSKDEAQDDDVKQEDEEVKVKEEPEK